MDSEIIWIHDKFLMLVCMFLNPKFSLLTCQLTTNYISIFSSEENLFRITDFEKYWE